ncbi:MAG TPA: alpha/beta hydrolase [Streptosporangiaceae bacterium]
MSSEDVTFRSGDGTLAGTFLPVPDPVATALLITGSGPADRNSDAKVLGRSLRTGVTRAVAEALAGARVSSLRYDKRGVGASEGDALRAGMADRRADARAARAWLAGREPGRPVLAIGHSEGAWYAAELAADGLADGAVLLAGGARPGGQVLSWQVDQIVARLPALARLLIRITRQDPVATQRRRLARITSSPSDVVRVQGIRMNARWMRDFVAYDPAPVLARIAVPVLAITGGQDIQVPPADVQEAGRLVQGPFEGHVTGNLSHLFRPDPASRGLRDYRRSVRQPVSPELLTLITGWVARTWGGS